MDDNRKTIREVVGDPDSQESKIVRVRSSLSSEMSEDCMRRRVKSSIEAR